MQAELKIRTLAAADTTLRTYFGTPPAVFRWMDRRLLPGYIQRGACVRLLRVSTISDYNQYGLINLNQPRVQIDVLSQDPSEARNAAQAIITWMDTVSFSETNNFDSPATTPPHSPNFLLNRRSGMEAQPDPIGPVFVETLDYRIFNLEN